MMEALDRLPDTINEMINDFIAPAMYGNDYFGLTQYIFWMLIAVAILLIVLFAAKKRESLVLHGRFVNAIEFVVEFARNDIVYGVIGHKNGDKHMPFILTVFFFVLINNLVGLIPGCRPGTGTIGVTFAIALCSFIYFVALSIKIMGVGGYIKSFAPKGVALPIGIMVGIIEVFSTILRLVTLAIRLFANMFAGHIAMGSFALMVSIMMGAAFQVVTALSFAEALAPIAIMLILIVIYAIEMLVAVIQAYVFAVLSAVYIQLAEGDE
jgi:F-type H+-transporting ATPase subunit a